MIMAINTGLARSDGVSDLYKEDRVTVDIHDVPTKSIIKNLIKEIETNFSPFTRGDIFEKYRSQIDSLFRNASQKRLLIPQLPSATRSSEVDVRGEASQSLCSQYAVCCQNHVVSVAERVGESKVMLGHTNRSGICAQVPSIFLIWYSLRCLSESQYICHLYIVYQHKFWNNSSSDLFGCASCGIRAFQMGNVKFCLWPISEVKCLLLNHEQLVDLRNTPSQFQAALSAYTSFKG
jgi:hypothetical protein